MILFIFAHKGEASTFLKELSLSPIPLIFDGLFGDKDKYLLLILYISPSTNILKIFPLN